MSQQIVGREVPSIPDPHSDPFSQTLANVAGQLAPRSQKTYRLDAQHFQRWLTAETLMLTTLNRDDFIRYRDHLQTTYAKSTAGRMLTVARRLLEEAVRRGILATNPAEAVRGFAGAGGDETPRTALSKDQVRAMLAVIDRSTLIGYRDYALVLLLLKTGLRRSEASALTLADFSQEQGHAILTVRHGKGDKRRVTKCPVDVARAIRAYLEATARQAAPTTAPLFVRIRKADKVTADALQPGGIEKIIRGYGTAIGADLTPHGCRASFITLALEGGAKLQQVQYAAGHADPRTTERYQKRKLNLDDHASDYLHF